MPKTDLEIIAALEQTNGVRVAAAKLLGMNERTLRRRLSKIPDAPRSVYPAIPSGHKLKGVSTLSRVEDPDTGEMILQWVKSSEDASKRDEQFKNALDELSAKLPRVPAVKPPKANLPEELANLYVLTDFHLGMLAWGEESGADWDMKIAERLATNWFEYAVKTAPRASQGILAQLGDFLHYDSMESLTPTSKHILDADSRPQKMVRVAIRVLRRIVDIMLKRHDTVHVIMAEGNHDPMASIWLREAFTALYENEPRVTIEKRPDPYYAFVWGQTLLLFHHGHLRKPSTVDAVFARKFRKEYGQAKKVYAHMGHLHHRLALESTLMEIEQHPTLAAADAYASRGGWLSERIAKSMTYHKQYGEIGRIGIPPEMVSDA